MDNEAKPPAEMDLPWREWSFKHRPFSWGEPRCILTQSYAGVKTAKLKFPNYITLSVLPAPLSYFNLHPEVLEQQQDSFKLGPWGTVAIAEGFCSIGMALQKPDCTQKWLWTPHVYPKLNLLSARNTKHTTKFLQCDFNDIFRTLKFILKREIRKQMRYKINSQSENPLLTAIWKEVLEHFSKIVRNYGLLIWMDIKGNFFVIFKFIY